MGIEDGSFIFSRHTNRADGSMGLGPEEGETAAGEYPHVTKEGVKNARNTALKEFAPLVDEGAEDSILFIGGSSEEERTKETAEIIGDVLAERYKGQEDVKSVTRKEVELLKKDAVAQGGSVLDKIQEVINENSKRKVIVTYPLFLKELSLRPHIREKKTGEHTEFTKNIIADVGKDEVDATREWFRRAATDPTGLSPQQIAELQLQAIHRLQNFGRSFVEKRPFTVGVVGHGWNLDALAVYLANDGVVDLGAFKKHFDERPIGQAEVGKFLVSKGRTVFSYRGKEYEVPREILK